jgi:L-amino acid N-acyltransferase YncA
MVWVYPALRNVGLGQILAHAIHESRRVGEHRLRARVARANLSAVHLHLNFGFRFLREVSGGLIGFLDLDE